MKSKKKSKKQPPEKPTADANPSRARWQVYVVLLLPALCLLPFVGKAYNIDDPLFLWGARQILAHPLDFFGFNVNWSGTLQPMFEINKNPPGVSYFIAPAYALFGDSEIAMHLALLIPVVALGLATYLLAREFAVNRLLAVLYSMLTPAVLVSGLTVMSDMLMVAFYAWAIYLWVRDIEQHKPLWLAFSMLCVSGSFLSKYFGMTCLPVLLGYTLFKERKPSWKLLWLLAPVALAVLYELYTRHLYGAGMLHQAFAFQHDALDSNQYELNPAARAVIGLGFAGGSWIGLLFAAPLLCSWRKAGLLAVAAAALVGLFRVAHLGRPAWRYPGGFLMYTEWVLFVFAGLVLFYLLIEDLVRHRDALSVLLLLLITGTFAYSAFINYSVNVRTILPMAPAVGLLMARAFERKQPASGPSRAWRAWAPLVPAAAVALAAVWGDFAWANTTRGFVEGACKQLKKERGAAYYLGHWGFQYYLDKAGVAAVDLGSGGLNELDIVMAARNNSNNTELPPHMTPLPLSRNLPASTWVCTMNMDAGAGFYVDYWGPLPYFIGPSPLESFVVGRFNPRGQH